MKTIRFFVGAIMVLSGLGVWVLFEGRNFGFAFFVLVIILCASIGGYILLHEGYDDESVEM